MAHGTSTAAIVVCRDFRFGSDANADDMEVITMIADTKVNGHSPDAGISITFARSAGRAVKVGLVRDAVNAHIQANEPGAASLTDANIQISGLPA